MAILTQNEMQHWQELNSRFVSWRDKFGELKSQFLQLESEVYLPNHEALLRKAAIEDDLAMRIFRLSNFLDARLNTKET